MQDHNKREGEMIQIKKVKLDFIQILMTSSMEDLHLNFKMSRCNEWASFKMLTKNEENCQSAA
jgi:hypothetical protein